METGEELKKWVDALSAAEKRFVKLIGKARAGSGASQQLDLFDWLNAAKADEPLPDDAPFMQNLPTVSNRMKDLVLDSLRILGKNENTDASLRTGLDELAILFEKKLIPAAARHLKRIKKAAAESCRYGFLLQCIEWEFKMLQLKPATGSAESLQKLREEERAALQNLAELRDLQYRHDQMLALVRQHFYHRDTRVQQQVNALAADKLVSHHAATGNYLEQALAVNLLGMKNLYDRNPQEALLRYQDLLHRWKQNPAWQADQVPLLLNICRFYQSACFYCPVDWEQARGYLAILNEFKGLPADANRDFQRLLFHNQFTLALNMGNFDSVNTLIPEIENWLIREESRLTEVQVLPFLCNFAVAEFLNGNMLRANRFVMRILQMPNRRARTDIREFALVLQAVVQYEMGNKELNEYLTRAGRRHFSNTSFDVKFELAVFKYLDVLNRAESHKVERDSLDRFIRELEELAAQLPATIPLLGLNEIHMWASARRSGIPLRTVFLEAVKQNLEALENPARKEPAPSKKSGGRKNKD
jgi:hypothetical protein